MYVVQIGYFAWVAKDSASITHSPAFALAVASRETAEQLCERVRRNWRAYVDTMPERPRTLRRYHLSTGPQLSVVPLDELRERTAKRDDSPAAGKQERRDQAIGDKPAKAPGITRQVYQWCIDHPQASKADALAAWPGANPSTVGVQFGAARRAAI